MAPIFILAPFPNPGMPIWLNIFCISPIPGIDCILFKRSMPSLISSLSFSSPDLIFSSILSPIFFTIPIILPGFLKSFWNTSFASLVSSKSKFRSFAVSSANSIANLPSLPPIMLLICS